MALKYLRSAAAGAGTGADWTNAYTTLVLAYAGMGAGDTVYVADDHAETQNSAMALTSPGTVGNPCRVICVNTHVTVPPVATAASATITTTGNFAITFTGFAYFFGITFNGANGSTSGSQIATSTGSATGVVLDSCKLVTPNTGSGTKFAFGATSASSPSTLVRLINTTVKFANAGQQIVFSSCDFEWRNTASAVDVSAATPTTLFSVSGAGGLHAVVSGVDLASLGSGKNLVNVATGNCDAYFYIRNCKLGASVSAITGTIASPATTKVFLDNGDSGATTYRMEHYLYEGSIVTETTKVLTAGASDGVTHISHKFVTLSTGPSLFAPLKGPWMTAWNDTLTAVNVTVEILHDSLTNLQNADVWLEVEYLGTSGYPESVYSQGSVADVFATPADCAAGVGTGSWTTSGLVNPNSQKLVLPATITAALKGPIRARVCVAKANYTLYVDPSLTVA